VRLQVSIGFDEFGWSLLEERARAEKLELNRLLTLACRYYVSELAAARTATRAPRFAERAIDREMRPVVLELDARTLKRLEQAAEQQRLRLGRLIEHAAIFFIAELDAGRVAERIMRLANGE
jgi:hypothetical protein